MQSGLLMGTFKKKVRKKLELLFLDSFGLVPEDRRDKNRDDITEGK